jgi:plastocyanin
MRRAWLAAVVASLLVTSPGAAATLRGRVEVVEKDARPAQDIADAVVWVEGPKGKVTSAETVVVMRGKAFVPRVAVVGVGGTVAFPNQDPIFHNAFSVSGENRFDLDLYKKPKSASWTFKYPGLVRVFCNIHPQMSAFVLVRDNPFWARPAGDGSFEIPDVPAGTWVLKAWHERAGEVAETLRVPETGSVAVALKLDASSFKRAPHKNKYGKDYAVGEKY